MKPRIAKAMPQHERRKREGMSADHLKDVRSLPCVVCGWSGTRTQAHHLLRTEERGLSRKSSDRWAIPLCPGCHTHLHAAGDEEGYLTEMGIDGRAVASALWACRGDPDGMLRIILRWRLTQKRKPMTRMAT